MKHLVVFVSYCALAIVAQATEILPPYCVDFQSDACTRIKTIVDSKVRPDYCVPGYALKDSGLTQEQRRVCYAMPIPIPP